MHLDHTVRGKVKHCWSRSVSDEFFHGRQRLVHLLMLERGWGPSSDLGERTEEGIWKARITAKTWWFCTGRAKGVLGASISQSGSGSTLLRLYLLCLTSQKGALFRGWANWGIKVYEVDLVIQECNVGFLTVSRTRLKHPNSAQNPPWLVSSF